MTEIEKECPVCKDVVDRGEDEFHFVFECKMYDNVRKENDLFKMPIAIRNNLVGILKSNNECVIVNLAKFVAEAFKVRKAKIEESTQ